MGGFIIYASSNKMAKPYCKQLCDIFLSKYGIKAKVMTCSIL